MRSLSSEGSAEPGLAMRRRRAARLVGLLVLAIVPGTATKCGTRRTAALIRRKYPPFGVAAPAFAKINFLTQNGLFCAAGHHRFGLRGALFCRIECVAWTDVAPSVLFPSAVGQLTENFEEASYSLAIVA